MSTKMLQTGQERIKGGWIDVYKEIDGKMAVKSRFVARGYMETEKIRSDSPTVCKSNIKLATIAAAKYGWKLEKKTKVGQTDSADVFRHVGLNISQTFFSKATMKMVKMLKNHRYSRVRFVLGNLRRCKENYLSWNPLVCAPGSCQMKIVIVP